MTSVRLKDEGTKRKKYYLFMMGEHKMKSFNWEMDFFCPKCCKTKLFLVTEIDAENNEYTQECTNCEFMYLKYKYLFNDNGNNASGFLPFNRAFFKMVFITNKDDPLFPKNTVKANLYTDYAEYA